MDEMTYKIEGIKLDNNDISLSDNNLLWRTTLGLKDIKNTIDKINLLEKKYSIKINTNIFESRNIDWIEKYKSSIEPVICGDFYIHPSWHCPSKSHKNILLDPSLSFGSGHHESTFMCMQILQNIDLKNKDMLDIGCGSGILSMIGKMLGASVYLCDSDIECINQSKSNFTKNNLVLESIWHGSISDNENATKQYDVIVANIVSSIILLLKDKMLEKLNSNGVLIVSGILSNDVEKMHKIFSEFGYVERYILGEWASLKINKN